jgi:hypothetical protein
MESWSGSNKARTREHKKIAIKKAIEDGFIKKQPHCITLAGAKASFERKLVNSGITTSDRIVTVQRCKKKEDEKIFDLLRRARDNQLKDMLIWPEEFSTFSSCYRRNKVILPDLGTSSLLNGGPRWFRKRLARDELVKFKKQRPKPASIFDIDLCGTFTEKTAKSVVDLFANKVADKRGFLFLNLQKGREPQINKIYNFVRKYLSQSSLYDFDKLQDSDGERLDLSSPDYYTNEVLRVRVVPIYFICELFRCGYMSNVHRLIEYRDLNKASGMGNIMRQWFFRFEAREMKNHKRDVLRLKSIIEETFDELHELPSLEYGLPQIY